MDLLSRAISAVLKAGSSTVDSSEDVLSKIDTDALKGAAVRFGGPWFCFRGDRFRGGLAKQGLGVLAQAMDSLLQAGCLSFQFGSFAHQPGVAVSALRQVGII